MRSINLCWPLIPIFTLVIAGDLWADGSLLHLSHGNQAIADSYQKVEYDVPMRDKVLLHVVVYSPKADAGIHPILLERTPYSAGPYGSSEMRTWLPGSHKFQEKGYIFAFADVRGQYLSQGQFSNIRPQLKHGQVGIDESTDTFDTIDFLVKQVPQNNGKVGLWGVSYPGFYAAVGAINSHPALKAVSPQAPVSNWFLGDDVHHNGAFFLQDNFDFSQSFDVPRKGPETSHQGLTVERGAQSAYRFFLNAVSSDGLEKHYFHGAIPYWNELNSHPNYDQYWKDRNLIDKFCDVRCPVLTVGGLYDAEDMWGAWNLFKCSSSQNPKVGNFLVMGPWSHGMWTSPEGSGLGEISFGSNTSEWFREKLEFPFFEKFLRDQALPTPAIATIFETGSNRWHQFPSWPPKALKRASMYLASGLSLTSNPQSEDGDDTYHNDPNTPTPYLADWKTNTDRTTTYMVDDQRWATGRSDVLTYKGPILDSETTIAGPIQVDFWIKTTGTDADLVVKVIDEYPAEATEVGLSGKPMSGFLQNVRSDIMRCRFRNSFSTPSPMTPGVPTRIKFDLNDVLHTFRKGHRIVVQVQSNWFPLVDRNPNQFVDIYHAVSTDFIPADITLLRGRHYPSRIQYSRLNADLVEKTVVH